MDRAEGRALLRRVDAVRRRIEEWRATRAGLSPMPAELWAASVSLAREHGVYAIARSLRLDHGGLKRRVEQAGGAVGPDEAGAIGFVEVKGEQLAPGAPPAESVVEMTRADGSRMVARLAVQEGVDVVALAATFWGRGS